MFKCRYALLAACGLSLCSTSLAATPDQVGTWVGSLKTKVRTTTSTRSVKSAMQLEIAADDTTTVTLDGVLQLTSGEYVPGEGLFFFIDLSGPPAIKQTFAVAHFKGAKVKGATSGITGTSELVEAFSGKFSLKKQP
jgi:hypothetical protein